MPFCTKCGAQFEGDGVLCFSCESNANQDDPFKESFARSTGAFGAADDYTVSFNPKDIQANKGMGVLAYLGILFCVPYFTAQKSKFSQFHAKQGMILFLFEVVINLIMGTLRAFLSWIRPIGFLLTFLHSLFGLAIIALIIIGISNVLKGRAKELPFIGKFTKKL